MNPTPQEIAWLCLWLEEHKKKMPSPRKFEPYYNASSWDLDDLFRAFREDAVSSRHTVWQTVLERSKTGAWPKTNTEVAFWLRERWEMAQRYCRGVLESRSHSANVFHTTAPTDTQAAIEWLLLDLWDTRLVDVWIRERAREFVFADDRHAEDSESELDRYLCKLERLQS